MPRSSRLGDELARLGQVRPIDPQGEQRKHEIEARVFGDPTPPRRIGRFIDLGLLGHGAMGTVRKAYDEKLAREVAIKLVRNARTGDDERVLREAQALAQVSHPNVVQVYETGMFDHKLYIAMELVDGISLGHWQRERRPWRDCLSVYLQAGRGLAAAHSAGLIHRDFKPANCIRDTEGRVRVLDFGLARAAETFDPIDSQRDEAASTSSTLRTIDDGVTSCGVSSSLLQKQLTENDSVVGTVAYMAPEQFKGRQIDARSDQFSFCVALYEALYGQPPFTRDPRPILWEMAGGVDRCPAFGPAPRRIPQSVQRALRRGLAAEPEARWPSMEALLRELERPLQGTWNRRLSMLAAVTAGAVLATAFLTGDAPCLRDQDKLDDTWAEGHRESVRDALLSTKAPHAIDTWETIQGELNTYAREWKDAHLATCIAALRYPEQTARTAARRRCLRRRRASFGRSIERLSRADGVPIDAAVRIVADLPLVEDCADASEQPTGRSRSPAEEQKAEELTELLDRARTLETPEEIAEGLSVMASAVATAETLGVGPLLAEALLIEGLLLERTRQYETAETKLDAAVSTALQSGADEVAVEAWSTLGDVIGVERTRTETAVQFLRYSVDMAKQPGIGARPRALALTSLGDLLTVRGEFADATAHYGRALEVLEAEYDNDHINLSAPLDGLAQALRKQGKTEQAMKHRLRALAIDRHWLGDRHPDTATARANIAAILYDQGKYDEAQRQLELALDVFENAWEPDYWRIAHARTNLAAALGKQGQHARAEEQDREAIVIWEYSLGPTHPYLAKARLNFASTLKNRGHIDEAAIQYGTVLDILEQNEQTLENSRVSAHAHRDLGSLHFKQGHLLDAAGHYNAGITLLKSNGGHEDPMAASLINCLGDLAREHGDSRQALALHGQALAIYQDAYGPNHIKITHTLRDLAYSMIDQGQEERAEDALERAHEIFAELSSTPSPDTPSTAESYETRSRLPE